MSILRRATGGDRSAYFFWCPGCDDPHMVWVNEGSGWTFNGDTTRPTFSPSLLVNGGGVVPGTPVCHSFIRNGQIEFLSDCSHALAGQTVPIPEWPKPNYGGCEPC